MAKQTFTTGQVLTAAEMTSLQQTAMGGGSTTAKTTSYVLVAADAGTVVQMNSASATTITVNTALFSAGDTVKIQNVGAGVCTITAGTATVSTSAVLTLKQYDAGTLYFNSTSAAFFFAVDAADGMANVLTTTGDTIYSSSGTTAARLGIGTAGQVLTVNSGATAPEWATPSSGATYYGCQVSDSTDQAIPNGTDTALTWNQESFDQGGYHSTSANTSRLTIPSGKAGYYLLNVETTWGANATGNRVNSIRQNGTQKNLTVTGYVTSVTITGSFVLNQTWIAYGAVGDYFEAYVQQSSGGTLNVLRGSTFVTAVPTWFSITYLGA